MDGAGFIPTATFSPPSQFKVTTTAQQKISNRSRKYKTNTTSANLVVVLNEAYVLRKARPSWTAMKTN